jgi:Carboxypeptidase regulatory-like domain/TonB-dependent Receptor Plug Domain/TonB dependent receptor
MKGLIAVCRRNYLFRLLLIVLVGYSAGAIQMSAQVVGGTIVGTVTDQSGAIVPRASILIKNLANGVNHTVTTDPVGFYTAPNLLPGTYEVTASAVGFASIVKSGITLTVGNQRMLNFTLNIGQVSEVVRVLAEASAIDLASSEVEAVVDSTTIRELPLNGRSWTDLATLQPGALAVETQSPFTAGSNRGNRGFENEVAINGARPQQNNYRLDGISIEDYANGGSGSVLGGNLGVDAIEEFSVLTTNMSAAYGRTSGGVINAVTRSGTNTFHGDAYEFLRNSALDAANFFDNAGGIQKPDFKRNQFGASAGGPVLKDKIFIFGDYEGIRQSQGIASPVSVPSDAARLGVLLDSNGNLEDQHGCGFQGWTQVNGCPNSGTPTAPLTSQSQCPNGATSHLLAPGQAGFCVDDSVAKYLPFWHQATSTAPGSNVGSYTFAGQQVVNEDFFTIRSDYKISDKDTLAATYMRDVAPYNAPDGLNAVLINSATRRQVATLEETHVFNSQIVNAFRLGYSRAVTDNDHGFTAINPLSGDPSLAALPGQFASAVTVPGLTVFTGGVNGNSRYQYHWNSDQLYDDAFYTRGTHSLKFGVGFERIQLNQSVQSDQSGGFFFGSLAGFLTNQPTRFEVGLPSSVDERGLRQSILGLYVQDDWHWRPNFTLNLGLRWEMATVPTENHNAIANLQSLTDTAQRLGSPIFSNPTLHNFEPRVGFAWDPFHDGKTAVRGSFGMFDVLPLPYQFSLVLSKQGPFYQHGTARNLPQGSFYTGALPLLGGSSFEGVYIEPHPHRNYVMQWNMNVERELTNNLSATLAYVGSHGVHQAFRSDDFDMVLPTKTPYGYLWPSPAANAPVLNTKFGQIGGIDYGGSSSYNALLAGVTKRMSHGLEFQGSFTWGKSIDNSSGTIAGDTFSNALSSLHWFDLSLSRGLSDFDIRRTVVLSATWQVPEPKFVSGPVSWVTSGWELGTIFKANDGVPFTATFGTDGDPLGIGSSDPWAFPSRLGGPGCQSLVNPGNPNNYIKTQCFAVPTAPNLAFYNANCNPAFGSTNPQDSTYLQCFNLRGNAGRNILIGPGLVNLDVSIFKNNRVKKISENFNVQFRAEFFNILNRANFADPIVPDNTDIFDSTGAPTGVAGKLTSTTTSAREIQFAVKLFW